MKYNSVLDLHTHTIVSGHAYSTLREMAKAASDKGLELLGITEHAPKMPGTCHLFYFDNLRIVPRELYGIELVLGSQQHAAVLGDPQLDAGPGWPTQHPVTVAIWPEAMSSYRRAQSSRSSTVMGFRFSLLP